MLTTPVSPTSSRFTSSRLLAPLLALALLAPLLVAPSALAGGCPLLGAGTEADPYEVADDDDLLLVGNGCALSASYLQTADITLTAPAAGQSNHTPIGVDSSSAFTGVYDGGGFTITGLTIDTDDEYVGLFGYAENAVFRSITLVDVDVTGAEGVGGLVGVLTGDGTGGASIESVHVTGQVTGDGEVGGLAGSLQVTERPGAPITVHDSSAAVTVTGGSDGSVGGLVGYAENVEIVRSRATGNVTATGFGTGGLLGTGEVFIDTSYATGQVSGLGATGGLAGEAYDGSVTDSYATGDVTGTNVVGGLLGGGGATVARSYAAGQVNGANGATDLGGLVGSGTPGDVSDSFFDASTTGLATSAGGTGLLTADMKLFATFDDAGWAIIEALCGADGDVWGIDASVNDGYPFLLWQVAVADAEDSPCDGDDDSDDSDGNGNERTTTTTTTTTTVAERRAARPAPHPSSPAGRSPASPPGRACGSRRTAPRPRSRGARPAPARSATTPTASPSRSAADRVPPRGTGSWSDRPVRSSARSARPSPPAA
jgi:hypothetical protein